MVFLLDLIASAVLRKVKSKQTIVNQTKPGSYFRQGNRTLFYDTFFSRRFRLPFYQIIKKWQ